MKAKMDILRWSVLSLLLLAVGTSACSSLAPREGAVVAVPPTAEILPTHAEVTAPPSTPQHTPVPTQTPTPTPTLHPMTIESMRQGHYPGSDIVVQQVLDPGVNYSRAIASYQSEGLRINALLTVPDGDPPAGGWPAIVFNHGYIPPDVYRTTERYVAYVDWLARNGYVVFRIDYRGHDQSEGQASGAYGDPGYTVDVLNAVASIKRHPQVNPERVGMWGHSMGGYLTLRAMVISSDIKAGVIWAGVVGSYNDMFYNWRRTPSLSTAVFPGRSWRGRWVEEFGTPEDNPGFWNSVSANAYLQDLSGPVQLHHGTLDESVPLAFSETLSQQMQAVGKPVELYIYEGDNHNISNSFAVAMTRTIQFFDRYLKDGL